MVFEVTKLQVFAQIFAQVLDVVVLIQLVFADWGAAVSDPGVDSGQVFVVDALVQGPKQVFC